MIVIAVRDLLLERPSVVGRIADRIYPVTWPDAPEFPLVILQQVTGGGETDLSGDAGIESVRLQVDVYSEDGYEDAGVIAREIRRVLHGFKGGPASAPCSIDRSACINNADQPVPETERAGPRLRRRMLEFSIWYREV